MKKNKKTVLGFVSFALSLFTIVPFAVSCSQAINNNITKPSPIEPPFVADPNESIDQDNQLRTIDQQYVASIIKTNSFGYNPSSYKNQLKKWQSQKDDQFLNNVFLNKKVSNWSSLQNFTIVANDTNGEIEISFKYGNFDYNYKLNRNDGLMSDGDYNKRLDDLSFSFNFLSTGVVSNRGKFPILNPNNNQLVESDKNNEYDKQATFRNKGLKLGHQINDYVISQSTGGTGWLVDYLPSVNNSTQDFYEFIVATNIHVSNLSSFFMIEKKGIFDQNDKIWVALDPLYIKSQWFRHKGKINYDQPNQFNANYLANENTGNVIANLSFNLNSWNSGNWKVKDLFFDNVIRNLKRQNKLDSETFSSWDHPLNNAKNEKKILMEDLNFYKANYRSKFKYNDVTDQYWINLIGIEKETEYYNIASDLNFLKVQFKKSDLKSQWPVLYDAIENNKIKDLLIPINQNPIDLNFNNAYYSSGYPYYYDHQEIYQKNNGFKQNHDIGRYYRNVKLTSKFQNEWPNNVDFSFADSDSAVKGKLKWWQGGPLKPIQGKPTIDDYFRPYYSDNLLKHWNLWNDQSANETFNKKIYFNTKSEQINKWNTFDPNNAYSPFEYKASSSNRGMIQTYYSEAKKHMWSASEYIIGGYSGSMVISPKLTVMGIISSYEANTSIKGIPNAIFEDFVNTSSSIISGEKIILQGLLKQMKSKNLKSSLYQDVLKKM